MACDFRSNAAIDLDIDRTSGGHRAQVTNLTKRGGNKSLTAEAGVDGHHKHQIDHVDDVFDGRDRRARIQRDAGLLTKRADCLQRTMQMRSSLGMYRNVIASGFGKSLQIRIARRDHQVRVENLPGVRTHRFDDVRAERNVRHKMAVHHVQVDPVGAGSIDAADFFAQFGEIRSENRRRDDEGA